eukprot:scaffold4437_cov391-Prasinococcus_capsulatus_cf.AAC.17
MRPARRPYLRRWGPVRGRQKGLWRQEPAWSSAAPAVSLAAADSVTAVCWDGLRGSHERPPEGTGRASLRREEPPIHEERGRTGLPWCPHLRSQSTGPCLPETRRAQARDQERARVALVHALQGTPAHSNCARLPPPAAHSGRPALSLCLCRGGTKRGTSGDRR